MATVSTVTPTDPTQNTKVTYVKKDAALTVLFLDKTTGTTLATVNVDGKYGDQIKFSPAELIQSFEQKGYHLIVNEFGQAGTTLGDANNGKTYLIEFEHQTKTITPSDPGQPGQPINPNDPNGPKWPAGTGASDLVKGATQTIHYQGVGGVEDSVTTIKGAFEKTVTVDLITGKIVSETDFTGQANFETVKTPVVNGYHADKALAGGLTATPDQPNVSDTVTYQANGKVVPVDENGKPILGADQPTYPTDPSDPTKVLPVPVPAVPGYTTKTTIVTPSDPGANTTVTYEKVVDEAPITPVTPAKPTATPQAKQAPAKEAANQATLPQCKKDPAKFRR
ncbi:mucin-binding protein [Limosilactobacillus fermentum]|uniref:mucin-binding protein n=1 Tax=Limosilactobacillus fermentum TaxID=1613 RepID=UPI00124B6712|nr:mucin-binding protein [Limosilactobacillus fermentum]KAB1962218.1 mucin-binding protein [Limosilactobacillus fermentum]MCS8619389.1 mucin-binding protein [Limosilactobacillus fermentum]